jgi:hypothetical protein
MTSILELIQRQFDAYNARDLGRFLANFSDDVKSYRMPALEPTLVGKKQFGEFYLAQRFNNPSLRAELLSRIVLGNKVFGVLDSYIDNKASHPFYERAGYRNTCLHFFQPKIRRLGRSTKTWLLYIGRLVDA